MTESFIGLREKIIALVQRLDPPPSVSEEVERYMTRGEVAVELAKDESGFQKAAKEFSQALRIAPWYAKGYFNLGLVQEKAGNYQEAIRNLKLYLLAAPGAEDVKEVKAQIVKLEYKMESMAASQSEAERKLREGQALYNQLAGVWYQYRQGVIRFTWEIRLVGDQEIEMRGSGDGNYWGAWVSPVAYDPVTRTFPWGDPPIRIQVVSADHMIGEDGTNEWRRK